jgi:cytidylate kinase
MAARAAPLTITVSRQMGSLGYTVASLAAETLGFRLVWRELINQAAMKAGAPELALAAIDELGLLGICPSPAACQAYRQAVQDIITGLADEGNIIIIGRAGQSILAGRPGVIHVRVVAPFDLRAQRIAMRNQVSIEGAQAQVEASDRFRSAYLKRFYKINWDDPRLYDLVLNTAHLTPGLAADLIVRCAERWHTAHPPAIPPAEEIQFEPSR